MTSTKRSLKALTRLLVIFFSFDMILASEWTYISKAAKDFIKKLLQKFAQNRISAADALNDPWIK